MDGEFGISGVYLGVTAELGRSGVRRVVETELTDAESAELAQAAEAVRAKQDDVRAKQDDVRAKQDDVRNL